MKEIKIPFRLEFIIPICAGRKICTTRSKRYGDIGDYFYIGKSIKLKIIGVFKEKLGVVAEHLYKEEGCNSPFHFKDIWLSLHKKYEPDKRYFVHIFKREDDTF